MDLHLQWEKEGVSQDRDKGSWVVGFQSILKLVKIDGSVQVPWEWKYLPQPKNTFCPPALKLNRF